MSVSERRAPHMPSTALFCAGYGIDVFPVKPDKTPYTEHGFHDATSAREQVDRLWKKWPEAGIATADFDVVDVDHYKPECRETWEKIRKLIPAGVPRSRTPRGGEQYFFKPGTLRDGSIGPGVDCRYAHRNYVLLPPSRFLAHGRYEWVVSLAGGRLQPAPAFPLNREGSGSAKEIAKSITEGKRIVESRNMATFWAAVRVLEAFPMVDQATAGRMVQAWVDASCAGDLSEIDVPKQVRGAFKWVAEHETSVADTGERRTLPEGTWATRYGAAALAGILDELAATGGHGRTLQRLARRSGSLVAAGQLAEDVARTELVQAALAAGLSEPEARAAMNSGFADGLQHPARVGGQR